MKKKRFLLCIVMVLAIAFAAGCAAEPAEPPPAALSGFEPQVVSVTIAAPSLTDNMVNEPLEKEILIYLPPGYAAGEKSYPVFYFLPGYGMDCDVFEESMTKLINAGEIRDMIVVSPPGRNNLNGSFYVNSPITGNWEDFVVKDVVNYVDENYRTLAKAKSRGICGSSMGGFGAWNLAMLHPKVFGCAYALSPGVFDENNVGDASNIQPDNTYFSEMTEEQAKSAYDDICAGKSSGFFTLAYGSAFAYNPDAGIPYIDFVTQDNPEAIERWNGGFGNVSEKVKQYRKNFKKLRAFAIDFGSNDEYKWIPTGCRYFSQQLTAAGIPHELLEHDGYHADRFEERVENYMIPFFSENLAGE